MGTGYDDLDISVGKIECPASVRKVLGLNLSLAVIFPPPITLKRTV